MVRIDRTGLPGHWGYRHEGRQHRMKLPEFEKVFLEKVAAGMGAGKEVLGELVMEQVCFDAS